MKTQVIHLEPHDDLISISDRMAWTKTPRLLLVWPKRGRVAIRPFDLTLLRRRAWSLGAELGLVCRDGEIRQMAHDLEIPCFWTTTNAQRNTWETLPQTLPPQPSRVDLRSWRARLPREPYHLNVFQRIGVFALGLLALLLVVLVFVPSAELTIAPPAQEQSLPIAVMARSGVTQVYLSGEIPLLRREVELSARDSAPATGQATAVGETARVALRFINLTTQEVDVPAGTVLLSDTTPAISFVTNLPVTVPAGNGKTAEVQARAVRAGTSGNVPANSISVFQDSLGLKLLVKNPEPASGGSEQVVAAPSALDVDLLRDKMMSSLLSQARTQAASSLQPGDVLLPERADAFEVLEELVSPQPGQSGDTLTLELRIRFVAEYASYTDLHQLATMSLDASLPPGSLARPSTLMLDQSPPEPTEDGARWNLRARRTFQPAVDSMRVIALVRGRSLAAAQEALQKMYGGSTQINLRPVWWPWLPLLPFRISVTPSL